VLILLAARQGSKLAVAAACVAELKSDAFKISVRSVYRWRDRYLRFGFAGLRRKARIDSGYPRRFGEAVMMAMVDAAVRLGPRGNVAREFRRLRPGVCYGSFRLWVRRLQAEFLVTKRRGESDVLLLR